MILLLLQLHDSVPTGADLDLYLQVLIASHFGRPSPKKQTWAEMKAAYSLQPVAGELGKLLGPSFIGLAPDCVGEAAATFARQLEPGQVRETEEYAGGGADLPASQGLRMWLANWLCVPVTR